MTKKLKSAEELKIVLFRSGIDPSSDVDKQLMCGTGVTAVVLDLALEQAGIGGNRKVYDGSWTSVAPSSCHIRKLITEVVNGRKGLMSQVA